MKAGIKVFAPASVANVACGFDTIGFALEEPGDEIIARRVAQSGIHINSITGDSGKLPRDAAKNTATVAAAAVLKHAGITDFGLEFDIHKKMPFGSGLGSSAASAVAGAFAANQFLEHPYTKRELLPFAAVGEALASGGIHLDNIAPSMLGGFIFVRDTATYDVHRIYGALSLYITVVYPHIEILTKEARAILSPTVLLKDAVRQTGNLGGLIIGLYQSDIELIGRSLVDYLIEPQRAPLIPHFYAAKEAALEAGAMGCSISGSGPSIFAISKSSIIAEEVGARIQAIYKENRIKSELFLSKINNEGVIVC